MLYFIVHAVIFTLSDNSNEIHGILWQIFVIEFNHFLFYTVVSTAVTVIKTLLFIISAVLLCCWSVNWNHLHSLHDCSYLKPYCLWNINMSPVENHLAFFVIFCVGIEYWYFTYFHHFLGSLTTFQVSCYIRVCRKLRSIFWFFMLWFSLLCLWQTEFYQKCSVCRQSRSCTVLWWLHRGTVQALSSANSLCFSCWSRDCPSTCVSMSVNFLLHALCPAQYCCRLSNSHSHTYIVLKWLQLQFTNWWPWMALKLFNALL